MNRLLEYESSSLSDFQFEAHRMRVGALAQELDHAYHHAGTRLLQTAGSSYDSTSYLPRYPTESSSETSGTFKFAPHTSECGVAEMTRAAQGKLVKDDQVALAGEILRFAKALEEMIEWLPFEYQSMDHILDELASMNELGLWRPEIEKTLRKLSRDQMRAALSAGDCLPVSALASARKMAAIPVENLTVETLCGTAADDSVLAGDLLRVVNSWANPALRRRISSLREAVIYLGIEQARTVLLSSSSRALFASGTIRGLWKHSVQVASLSADLGAMCSCDPEDAFIAGLLHDVGRLAIEKLDQDTMVKRARLFAQALPTVWVDLLTCRHDHAEIGGALVDRWNLPKAVIEAVSLHHAPERAGSKLPAVLYLAELCAGKQSGEIEDLPSVVKTVHALTTTGLSMADVQRAECQGLIGALLASVAS